mmetsp:Transcript_32431/g.52544  ORF Transcript_32431/g.52544 Transcript_32431/m.52544 type:complete len:116 (+) Transcript_32431:108-455(+)|eukprot:jgi/Bigna1/134578/aug1.25_g9286
MNRMESKASDIVLPDSNRNLRACLGCRLIKTVSQWKKKDGKCENGCEKDYYTSRFSGAVIMMNPSKSWVSRWQLSENFVKGMYAVKVPEGNLDRVGQREDDEDHDEEVYDEEEDA